MIMSTFLEFPPSAKTRWFWISERGFFRTGFFLCGGALWVSMTGREIEVGIRRRYAGDVYWITGPIKFRPDLERKT